MRQRSKKTEDKYKLRRPLVARLLEERPGCEACHLMHDGYQRASVDVHELVSRGRGGSILDEQNLLCVCRECHSKITQDGKTAEFLGLALPSWTTDQIYEEAADRRSGNLDKPPSWWSEEESST